ncbi:MAG TPA: LPXTG cell wall anchor domain-containing protein [Chitinophagaceae bacterium]|nr:LPXTG cell wall anchor domain-containing protein [Chitinophagaceae bacterium]
MRSLKIFFTYFFLLAALSGTAQTITASVNKNKILLGEPLVLTIKANISMEAQPSFVRIDSLPHFEILGEPVIDTSHSNGSTLIMGTYTITSFDSGHWVIPSFSFASAKTDSIGIDVVFSEFNPEQEYHDIKDIIEVKPKKRTPWWWYAAGGLLLLALIMIYFLKRKKKSPVAQPKTAINAYDEAMKQLEQLKRERPAAKQFHTRLAEIFRIYIFKKKGILSLQKTTDDLAIQLKNLDLDKEQYDKLVQALRLGDFVKFAKYSPTSDDDTNCFNDIGNSIVDLEKKETTSPSKTAAVE